MNQSLSDFFDTNKPSLSDAMLLRSLGLPAWTAKLGEEICIGAVHPFAEHEPADRRTIISIYVNAMPAQTYRFEILRRSENFDGMEKLTVTTGSGSLGEFWKTALALASNMLNVSAVTPA